MSCLVNKSFLSSTQNGSSIVIYCLECYTWKEQHVGPHVSSFSGCALLFVTYISGLVIIHYVYSVMHYEYVYFQIIICII